MQTLWWNDPDEAYTDYLLLCSQESYHPVPEEHFFAFLDQEALVKLTYHLLIPHRRDLPNRVARWHKHRHDD